MKAFVSSGKIAAGTLKAAQYARMSSEHQKYSVENQQAAMAAYAAIRGIEIIRSYTDVAKSGLSLAGRPALQALLRDTLSGTADFNVILVYDVSRWGRFLDADESAHYEFICKAGGIPVRYCAEIFDGDGLTSGLFKTLKRAMAAEYVRELSTKTFAGQCRVLKEGYHVGGSASHGLRRMLVGEDGRQKGELGPGEYKSLTTERVVLVPGPQAEIQIVRRIFDLFVIGKLSEEKIARLLNGEKVPVLPNGVWTRARIHKTLINENYVGTIVFNRKTQRLGTKSRPNPPGDWVRCEGAIAPIVDRQRFGQARQIFSSQTRRKTDEQILDELRSLHAKSGRLTKSAITASREVADPIVFRRRFGGLLNAYSLIGYTPAQNYRDLRSNPKVRQAFVALEEEIYSIARANDATIECRGLRLFSVNQQFVLRTTVATATRRAAGAIQWRVVERNVARYDLVVVARMDPDNSTIADYYFLPRCLFSGVVVSLGTEKRLRHNEYRSLSLRPLGELFRSKEMHLVISSPDQFRSFLLHSAAK